MADWKELAQKLILSDKSIDARETRLLKEVILEDKVVDREELDFLIFLRNNAKVRHAKFEQFFFNALKKNVLADGVITAKEAKMIHEIVTADENVDRRERKFIREVKKEAQKCAKEYDQIFAEYLEVKK